MIEFVDTQPDVNVPTAEYKRLLGYPRDAAIDGRALELMDWARDWYSGNGRPWVYSRRTEGLRIDEGSIFIEGVKFTSRRLQATLVEAQADRIVLVAVSAGEQLEQAAQDLWREEKPDEYFFLEVYGSSVVEHLVTMHGAQLCAGAESEGLAVLPHCSPGYTEWDLAEQPRLLALIRQSGQKQLPDKLEVLSSGMLRPKKSLLAVFGLTPHTANLLRRKELNPCESCSFAPCQYRRATYRWPTAHALGLLQKTLPMADRAVSTSTSLNRDAKYLVSAKTLARWSADRLTLTPVENGSIRALFHYEATTCGNLSRRLSFEYRVTLGPRSEGYPIRDASCDPAPDDEGHLSMCQFLDDPRALKLALEQDTPLLRRPLDDITNGQWPLGAAGCFCESNDRMHKWRLVLETVHYALVQQEERESTAGS